MTMSKLNKISRLPKYIGSFIIIILILTSVQATAKDIVLKNSLMQVTLASKDAYAINCVIWKKGERWQKSSISKVRMTIRYADAKKIAVYSIEEASQKANRPGVPDLESFTVDSVKQSGNKVVVNGHDKHFIYTKTVTLDSGKALLRVSYKLTSTVESFITSNTSVPSFTWKAKNLCQFVPSSKVLNGKLKPVVRLIKHIPSLLMRGYDSPMMNDWFGVWSPEKKQGTLVFFEGSEGNGEVRAKTAHLSIIPPFFSDKYIPAGKSFTQDIIIVPFAGMPQSALAYCKEQLKIQPLKALRPAKSPTARLLKTAKGIHVWNEAPEWKVFNGDNPPSTKTNEIKLFAAKDEYESTQLVFRTANKNLFNLKLHFSDLKGENNKIIPAKSLRWRLVQDYNAVIPFGRNGWSGETPDRLNEFSNFACIGQKNSRIWITLKVPETAKAGQYTGTIDVLQGEKKITALQMKVKLHVFNFQMPKKRNVVFLPQFSPGYLRRTYGTGKAKKLWNSYVKNLAEHRVSYIYTDFPTFSFKNEPRINMNQYQKFMDKYMDKSYHWGVFSKCFRIGVAHYPRDSSFGKKDQLLSKEWSRRYAAAARLLRAEMKKGVITDQIRFNIFDEPKEEFYDDIIKAAQLLRENFPEAKVGIFSSFHPKFIGVFNFWQVIYSQRAHLLTQKLKAKGDEVWIYNPDFACKVDTRGINSRIFFWWMWTNKIDGVLNWAMNRWGEWEQINFTNRNLAASWVYPGENGPIDSIRWELMREGIEDYEYFYLLEKLLKDNKDKIPDNELKKSIKVLNEARSMVVPKGTDGRILKYQLDSVRLQACRQAVAEQIENIIAIVK